MGDVSKTIHNRMRRWAAIAGACGALTACGGASVTEILSGAPTLDTVTPSHSLVALSADGSSLAVTRGLISTTASLLPDEGFLYVTFLPPGNAVTGTFTVIGLESSEIDAPLPSSGTITYSGIARASLNDGTSLFDVEGVSTVVLNASTKSLTVTLNGFSGNRSSLGGGTVSGAQDLTFTLTGATICSQTRICGGVLSISGDAISTFLSGSEIVDLDGALFGPRGAEIGGVLTVDDTTSGSIELMAGFAADQIP